MTSIGKNLNPQWRLLQLQQQKIAPNPPEVEEAEQQPSAPLKAPASHAVYNYTGANALASLNKAELNIDDVIIKAGRPPKPDKPGKPNEFATSKDLSQMSLEELNTLAQKYEQQFKTLNEARRNLGKDSVGGNDEVNEKKWEKLNKQIEEAAIKLEQVYQQIAKIELEEKYTNIQNALNELKNSPNADPAMIELLEKQLEEIKSTNIESVAKENVLKLQLQMLKDQENAIPVPTPPSRADYIKIEYTVRQGNQVYTFDVDSIKPGENGTHIITFSETGYGNTLEKSNSMLDVRRNENSDGCQIGGFEAMTLDEALEQGKFGYGKGGYAAYNAYLEAIDNAGIIIDGRVATKDDFYVFFDDRGDIHYALKEDVYSPDGKTEVYDFTANGKYTGTVERAGCRVEFDNDGNVTSIQVPVEYDGDGNVTSYTTLRLGAKVVTDENAYQDAYNDYQSALFTYQGLQDSIALIQDEVNSLEFNVYINDKALLELEKNIESIKNIQDMIDNAVSSGNKALADELTKFLQELCKNIESRNNLQDSANHIFDDVFESAPIPPSTADYTKTLYTAFQGATAYTFDVDSIKSGENATHTITFSSTGYGNTLEKAGSYQTSEYQTMTLDEAFEQGLFNDKGGQAAYTAFAEAIVNASITIDGRVATKDDFYVFFDDNGDIHFVLKKSADAESPDGKTEVYDFTANGQYTRTEERAGCRIEFDSNGRIASIQVPVAYDENGNVTSYTTMGVTAEAKLDEEAYQEAYKQYRDSCDEFDKKYQEKELESIAIGAEIRHLENQVGLITFRAVEAAVEDKINQLESQGKSQEADALKLELKKAQTQIKQLERKQNFFERQLTTVEKFMPKEPNLDNYKGKDGQLNYEDYDLAWQRYDMKVSQRERIMTKLNEYLSQTNEKINELCSELSNLL